MLIAGILRYMNISPTRLKTMITCGVHSCNIAALDIGMQDRDYVYVTLCIHKHAHAVDCLLCAQAITVRYFTSP